MKNKKLRDTLAIIKACYETLEDKKAIDIKILKVVGKSDITDYLVIATGSSEPHLRALKNELEKQLNTYAHKKFIRMDYEPESGWAIVDGFDFMVHLFIEKAREFYGLEKLWQDAQVIEFNDI